MRPDTLAATTKPGPDKDYLNRQVLLSGTIGISIAAATTIVRVLLRLRGRKLWWDDCLAIVSLLFLIITGVAGKLYYSLTLESTLPQHSRVALYYIFAVTFDLTIWTSRLSILLNIIRFGFYRTQLSIAFASFVVAMLILVSQVFWVCVPQNRETSWQTQPLPQCVLGQGVAITQVTTDIFADVVLVATPLLLLRYLQSEEVRAQRIRLGAFFAIGGLTTVVSIVHTVYLLQAAQVSIVVGNVELTVSVIICNFVVLATAVHQLWRKYHPSPTETRQSSMHFKSRELPVSESDTVNITFKVAESDTVGTSRS